MSAVLSAKLEERVTGSANEQNSFDFEMSGSTGWRCLLQRRKRFERRDGDSLEPLEPVLAALLCIAGVGRVVWKGKVDQECSLTFEQSCLIRGLTDCNLQHPDTPSLLSESA